MHKSTSLIYNQAPLLICSEINIQSLALILYSVIKCSLCNLTQLQLVHLPSIFPHIARTPWLELPETMPWCHMKQGTVCGEWSTYKGVFFL